MRRNPADLSQHYASLANDALLEINPDELTGDALVLYQSELQSRHLTKQGSTRYVGQPFGAASRASARLSPSDGKRQHRVETRCAGPKPCPTSQASDKLLANRAWTPSQSGWRGRGLHLHAVSVLDVKIFNPEMEEEWRTHFGFMSNADLVAMNPKDLTAGLLDRAERLERVYAEERERRGI
jgi:hypothetical protein